MKYVLIGNGAAGIATAEKIRKLDNDGEITILSSEKYAVYSKCLLPDFLSGDVSEERMFIRDQDFYQKNNIQIYYNHRVKNIDFQLKYVTTEGIIDPTDHSSQAASTFSYDKLLIASGSTQILPPVEGLKNANPYFLGTLDDAKNIIEASKNADKIIIIGGGFVGLETAFNLHKLGKKITIIERTPRILMGLLDKRAALLIQNAVEAEGMHLIVDCAVSSVDSNDASTANNSTKIVVLEDGRRIDADMLIVATGSRPNLEFIKGSGMNINKGILVDKYLQSSIEDVYAAGDVVESIDAVTEKMSLSPIWPNAVIQGEIAGSNMAGKQLEFNSLVSMQNASEFREIPMISIGLTSVESTHYEEYVDFRPIDVVYRKLVIENDIIIGMIFLGDIKNAGVIGALIKNKTNVKNLKSNLLNSNFGYSEAAKFI